MNKLTSIVSQFNIQGEVISIEPIGSGHINDSYLVATRPGSAPDYVLQRINHGIFKNVPELISNIQHVTTHIRHKLSTENTDFQHFKITQLIPATNGSLYFQDPTGDYWRLYTHIHDSRSYDMVGNDCLASEGGKAFAIFQHLTSDIDASLLYEILPGFHNIAARLFAFRKSVAVDPVGRVKELAHEIAFIEARSEEMYTILRLGEQGEIPIRVTHNDTKFNNILFDSENNAISIVDLDTVMPGYILYDFGDAIRTGANTSAEDEENLSKVNINLNLFEAYSRGYLGIARNFLNSVETDHLAFSAKFMTYIIGLRFLTDHIDGDRYFKTFFPGHNLQRARAQFKLLESMEEHFQKMRKIIDFIA